MTKTKISTNPSITTFSGGGGVQSISTQSVSNESSLGTPPNNEIWYTSTDGNLVTPYSTTGFGANIVMNVYENEKKGHFSFNGDVTSIGNNAFLACSNLLSIAIPYSVTSIEDYAFNSCISVTSITIPNSVTSIEEGVFCGCISLTSITIPNSVTNIGSGAFKGCSYLTSITFESMIRPTFDTDIFSGCSNLVSIYVPSVSVEAYKTATNFTQYADLIKAIQKPSYKKFLDLSGLKTFWSKLKTNFVSSVSTDSYLKVSSGSTKSIDLDTDKIRNGVTNTGTKLATDGYVLEQITNNADSALSEGKINELFGQIRLFYGDTTNYPSGILDISKNTTFSELKQIVEEKKNTLDPSMDINYILSDRTQSIGYGNFDAIKKYKIYDTSLYIDNTNFYDLFINGLFEDESKVFVYSPYNLTTYNDSDTFNNEEQLYSSAITLDDIVKYENLSAQQYKDSLIICGLYYENENNIDDTMNGKIFKIPYVEEMAEFFTTINKNYYNHLSKKYNGEDELSYFTEAILFLGINLNLDLVFPNNIKNIKVPYTTSELLSHKYYGNSIAEFLLDMYSQQDYQGTFEFPDGVKATIQELLKMFGG